MNAWPDPPDMPYSIASLQENFGNAVHTASVPLVSGRKVLVTGCGPVGVMAISGRPRTRRPFDPRQRPQRLPARYGKADGRRHHPQPHHR
jgi:hypothetical protein